MVDFSMCVSTLCQKHHQCYRFRAIPSKKQSYANFYEDIPLNRALCKEFIEILPSDKLSNS